MDADRSPAAEQVPDRLKASASLADEYSSVINKAEGVPKEISLAQRFIRNQAIGSTSSMPSCQQKLNLSFFFDGTGNNLDADIGTSELSNVAKLYLAHSEDDKSAGNYKLYIPGIGTYFKEIGDPGGKTVGLAFGGEGQKRIDWAFAKFQEYLKYHESLAQNQNNKITLIRISAFGFSRGATEARAFARMFQELCEQESTGWRLKNEKHSVQFCFLGLWDTVASVGLPLSANNMSLAQSASLMSTERAMRERNLGQNGVTSLAFGEPGADPAPGVHDGHMSWANHLRIVSMVERCVHMIAGHEVRNSFPVDSCLRHGIYPAGVEEMVYPGVHSDVGGGYRPGESARSAMPGQMLSLIPLRAMHQKAWEAGIPLYSLKELPGTKLNEYFAIDESSQSEFERMNGLWKHYMAQVGFAGQSIGQMMNAHMRLYYGWRFFKIRANEIARKSGQEIPDETTLQRNETAWQEEKKSLEREIAPALAKMKAAQRRANQAHSRLSAARDADMQGGPTVQKELEQAAERADAEAAEQSDPYLALKARYDTLPGTDGALARNLRLYDRQLLEDAQAIRDAQRADPSLRLRPHYRNLLEAYEAEFTHNKGMRDPQIAEFFENYVHDSLAGFARDATLPSDPRVVYVGDDKKSKHAMNVAPRNESESMPA